MHKYDECPKCGGRKQTESRLCRSCNMASELSETEMFWQRVKKHGPDNCWEWTGTIENHGYARIGAGENRKLAHRLCWEIVYGPIPDGMCVCHKCDNPGCVNPNHLFLGTQLENMQDREQKGRTARGSANGKAKLNAEQVKEIRKRYQAGGITYKQLGLDYEVSKEAIQGIVKRRRWTWVQ